MHTAVALLDITQQSHPAKDPVIWVLVGFQVNRCNVRQICSPRFLVNRALVHPGISSSGGVDCVNMNDGHRCEENLLSGFHKLTAPAIPPGPVKV